MDRALQGRLEQDPLLHEATEWFFELRSNDVTVERISEWQRWLAADSGNQQSFERVESFWRMGSQAVTTHWPTDAEVDEDGYDGEQSISAWRESAKVSRGKAATYPRHLRFALAAGVALMLIASGWIALTVRERPDFAVNTTVGETRTLPLPDGSIVAISGDTVLTANFGSLSRDVRLEQGEAFFHVAKDTARPFTVRAGHTAVTAIGTAFNVRKAGDRIVVAVSEGSVRVATPDSRASRVVSAAPAAQLKAGQQLSLEPASRTPQVAPVDANSVAGWRQGRLQYLNEPLELVVADLARYSTRNIRIADAEVANMRVTGIVFEQNIDGWLASLQATFPVQVLRDASGGVTLKNALHAEQH
jgi:transmembrane sensor